MPQGPRWTENEDAILFRHYANEGLSVSARLPGRTKSAAKKRAAKLGLQAPKTVAGLMPSPLAREEQEERMPIHIHAPIGAWTIDHPVTASSVFRLGGV